MVTRDLQEVIETRCFQGKAIMLIGARQVGKTTLMRQIVASFQEPVLQLNCDEPEVLEMLTDINTPDLKLLLGNHKMVLIDEAQQVPNIGMSLKRIVDGFPEVQMIVSGSSSFELQNKLNESLTGRKFEYHLFPFSIGELMRENGLLNVRQTLEQRLVYGSYPEIVNRPEDAEDSILNIVNSYLYKDILALENVRRPSLVGKLVKALAFQVGSEVSFNEIAQTIGTDNKTVEKYVDLLEKCFVVFRLDGLNRNMRNELKKGKKIYFWDNGVRNAVIQNFNPVGLRQDMGALWENFFISERLKYNHYSGYHCLNYFWRTTQAQEIDYVEERNGEFTVFEMKWNPKKANVRIPKSFMDAYPVKQTVVITPENYLEWVGVK